MNCLERFNQLKDDLKSKSIDIDVYNTKKQVDILFNQYDIATSFFSEIERVLDLIYGKEYPDLPHYRKLLVNESPIIDLCLDEDFKKLFSIYMQAPDVYYDFNRFIFQCKEWLINFDYMDINHIQLLDKIEKFFNIGCNGDQRVILRKNVHVQKEKRKYTFDDYFNNNIPNENAFLFSEFDTYYNEQIKLLNDNPEWAELCEFVSEYFGDGYGYDVYTYDPYAKREKLIEVKYTRTGTIRFTRNEYLTAKTPIDGIQHDYYVYCYFHDENDQFYIYVFKYNSEKDLFINIKDSSSYFFVDRYGFRNGEQIITILEPEDIKRRKEIAFTIEELYYGISPKQLTL